MHRKYTPFAIVIAFLITAFFQMRAAAQNGWDVPADKKAKNSYVRFNDTTAREGEAIFVKNCQSCHGDPGKGNSLKSLNPVPPDLASVRSQQLTDGELFWIISTGRLVMPSFRNIISDDERWKVISYIRSFNKKYVQVLSKINPAISKLVHIKLEYDSVKSKMRVWVTAREKTGAINLHDAEVTLFVNRYFGKLQIDKVVHTSTSGLAVFSFPNDLPGDKEGNIELVVNVNDEVYGEIESVNKLKIGVPVDKPPLNEKRAIWNILNKAPLWIIITFTTVVLAVGGVLLLILRNLMKIRKIGNNLKS